MDIAEKHYYQQNYTVASSESLTYMYTVTNTLKPHQNSRWHLRGISLASKYLLFGLTDVYTLNAIWVTKLDQYAFQWPNQSAFRF